MFCLCELWFFMEDMPQKLQNHKFKGEVYAQLLQIFFQLGEALKGPKGGPGVSQESAHWGSDERSQVCLVGQSLYAPLTCR